MPSDLQQIAQGLVECLDQVPAVVAHLQRTAQRCRDNAAYLAQLGARQPALYLDAAARACDEAAHIAAEAAPRGRAWAEHALRDAPTRRPTDTERQLDHSDRPTPREEQDDCPLQTSDRTVQVQLDLSSIDLTDQQPDSESERARELNLSSTKPADLPLLNAPPADATIRVDKKFTYTTDRAGRVVEARAELDIVDLGHPRDTSAQRKLAGKLPGDHAGHIFARIFRGPLGRMNLMPMAGANVNLSLYKTLENHWRRIIDDGGTVEEFVTFSYKGDSRRPDTIWVEYEHGDELVARRISNDSIPPKGTP
jgi:hypothetical protein